MFARENVTLSDLLVLSDDDLKVTLLTDTARDDIDTWMIMPSLPPPVIRALQ